MKTKQSLGYKAPAKENLAKPSGGSGLQFDDLVKSQQGKSPDQIAQTAVETTNKIYGGDPNVTAYGGTPNTETPTKTSVYPVVSAGKAKKDYLIKQNDVKNILTGMQKQQIANVANKTTEKTVKQQQDVIAAQNQPSKTLDEIKNLVQPAPEKSDTTKQLEEVSTKQDAAYEDYKNQVDQIRNGTFPLTPDQEAIVNYTQKQFDQLAAQQKLANQNYEAGMAQLGIVSGRSRYAPEIQTGLIQQAVSNGISKLNDLEAQAALTVSQLRQSFQDKNYQMINDSYEALQGMLNQKTQIITGIAENVRAEAQLSLQQHQSEVEDQKFEYEKRQAAIKFATDNNINKPFYLVGNTAFDTQTGLPVSHEEFLRLTGQDPNTPEGQADYSMIQEDIETPEERQLKYNYANLAQDQAQFEEKLAVDKASSNNDGYTLSPGQIRYNADGSVAAVGGEKPLTETQAKDVLYAQRTEEANTTLNNLEKDIAKYSPAGFVAQTELEKSRVLRGFATDQIKQLRQAERNFLTAVLRRESGAAISPSEFAEGERVYFPRPGDDEKTLEQKAQARNTVISGFKATNPNQSTGYTKEQIQEMYPEATPEEVESAYLDQGFNSAGNASASTGNVVKGVKLSATKVPLIPTNSIGNKALPITQYYPEHSYPTGKADSLGNQCGYFVRSVVEKQGLTYPTIGDSLSEKAANVKKYGVPAKDAKIGSVVVTNESKTNGHVAYIIGKTDTGWILAESNYHLDGKVNYGRVIPFNSSSIIGYLNPYKK